jgi:hypothetical protein
MIYPWSMNVSRAFISLLIALPWAATAVAAPAETWEAVGPWGGGASLLAPVPAAPDNLYATTVTGSIFVTADHGLHWRLVSDQLLGPRHPAVLYGLIPAGNAVLRSEDGGASWRNVTPAARLVFPNALAIDPVHTSNLFLAADQGLWKSTDRGATWHPIGAGALPAGHAVGVAVDPRAPRTLYAAIAAAGIFSSPDAGATWSPLGTGLPTFYLAHLLLDPADPQHLYALTTASGIFRLTLPPPGR